jgi:signal transduction histidine kinase
VHIALCATSFPVGGEEPQRSVAIVVDDGGEGIADDVLPRIFEPFFTTGAAFGGTGLGLAVVKSIVDAHGGVVNVETRAGKGTRFTVHFPLSNAAVAGGRVA